MVVLKGNEYLSLQLGAETYLASPSNRHRVAFGFARSKAHWLDHAVLCLYTGIVVSVH